MIASFVGLVVIPMVIAGVARWAAARRRRGLAAGRAVHFRCRLDGHKGRLLADPRLDGPVFLDRSGNVTALPRGGEALDATVSTNGRPPFEKVNLRYRTPEGQVLRLRLATHDARTLGAWLGERDRPVSAPARRLLLPAAPPWAVLAFAASLLVGLATADVALLGKHTAAEVVRVDRDDDSCTVRWDGGAQQAAVDCDTTDVRSGDRIRITALPWPFLGEAVNTRTGLSAAAVLGGGLGLLGLGGALMVNPLACARRVRLARRARPAIPPRAAAGGEEGEDRWPALDDHLSYASLAAAARHGDRHRPGPRVTPPRRGFGRTSMSPRVWVLTTLLGTNAWYSLGFSSAAILEDHFHLGHWRFLVFGTVGIASLARIGWFAADRSALCGPVLRAARSEAGKGTWQPMRYVRLCRDPGEMALVLFRPEGGEVTAPLFLQPISRCRGSERRTVGGPAPVGEALVLDTGAGPLICEIDGVRYLPRGRATEAATDPARTRDELRSFAESHLRPVERS
ncbi:hypothetical protein [Streptomyces arenae]|uniref:hypothetical protein n=1 Tax=Streptomyces arenae TaxID=29301 RepID=UPI0026587BCB|nr:hypothetical protein [Streptomyces arenae]MCG7206713.1 hypothetical protein [Streptomyces arenae]